jgi:LPXTG-motif cell wall-anchored protein
MCTLGIKDAALYKGTLTDVANYVPPVETTEPETPPTTGDSTLVFAVIAAISVLGVAVVAKRRED